MGWSEARVKIVVQSLDYCLVVGSFGYGEYGQECLAGGSSLGLYPGLPPLAPPHLAGGALKVGLAVRPVSRLDRTSPRRSRMFGKRYVRDLIERSAENPADRRRFLKSATAAGLGMVGVGMAGSAATAAAATATASAHDANSISDSAILNF